MKNKEKNILKVIYLRLELQHGALANLIIKKGITETPYHDFKKLIKNELVGKAEEGYYITHKGLSVLEADKTKKR